MCLTAEFKSIFNSKLSKYFQRISRTNKRYYKGKKMPNFDSGSIMSYPLALRININKKQTNKQNFSALPTLMLVSVTIFSRAHSKHFILYHNYSKPITLSSWLSFFGSIKPDITARFFGYLLRVYFQFFIYTLKVCF